MDLDALQAEIRWLRTYDKPDWRAVRGALLAALDLVDSGGIQFGAWESRTLTAATSNFQHASYPAVLAQLAAIFAPPAASLIELMPRMKPVSTSVLRTEINQQIPSYSS